MTVRSSDRNRSGGAVFFLFLLGVVLTLGLYFVKTWVQTAKGEAAALEIKLASEQEVVSTLKSEIAHLQSPARVESLAFEQLMLEPVSVEQVIELSDIEERFPLKSDAAQSDTAEGQQP